MNRSPKVSLNHSPSVYIHPISPNIDSDYLRSVFLIFGEVKDVYIPTDYNTRQPRGFAYVEFHSDSDAENCVRSCHCRDLKIDGRYVTVEYAKTQRKSKEEMQSRIFSRRYRRPPMMSITNSRRGQYHRRSSAGGGCPGRSPNYSNSRPSPKRSIRYRYDDDNVRANRRAYEKHDSCSQTPPCKQRRRYASPDLSSSHDRD